MMRATIEPEIRVFGVPFDAIDAGNAAVFRTMLEDEFVDQAKIVLDLSKCEFIDSAGLGAIVWAIRRLTEIRGEVCICGVTKPVQALFELVRMNKLVAVFERQQDAIASLSN
jgi:anti-sigma B factor antagonist